MNNTFLILDVHNLAYRAMFSVGRLAYKGKDTGVLFGVLREVKNLLETFQPASTAFCFDGRRLKRKAIYPEYKRKKEKALTEEETNDKESLYTQLKLLRKGLLPRMGFRNMLHCEGYEADDLIASVCNWVPKGDMAVVVSTDSDLWQLLVDGRVVIWNPATKKILTDKIFRRKWSISPTMWADVKALSGCASDNVAGIKGVGPHRAIKFLSGGMKDGGTIYNAIIDGNDIYNRNLELVRLPFVGTPKCKLKRDRFDRERWDEVVNRFGMVSLTYRRMRR